MNTRHLALSAALIVLLGSGAVFGQASLEARIDAIVNAPIASGKVAGASVAVVKGGKTILMKGYGLADLELNVPTPPLATYEIGSVTKQFTAAAILLLQEDGKLSLDDEVTKFLPDYPTQGYRITLRRLLDHTSGIKGYTELAEFEDFQRLDRPRDELVTMFSEKPFDFAPGEEQIYNNSAFFLLGLVIEKASGMSYAAFVQQRLFDRVGMKNSYYCSERKVRRNHAHGYDTEAGVLVHKGFLDHDWPYAAGSLCSNTADLVAWNRALHGRALLSPASYAAMTTPGVLNDGTAHRYGLGIGLADIGGRRAIAHGGGIDGFLSESQFYPDNDMVIVVLLNTAGPVRPRDIAREIADAVLGPAPNRSRPFAGDLSAYAGVYSGRGRGRSATVTIAVKDQALTLTRSGASKPEALEYRGGQTFGFGDTLVTFESRDGAVARLRLDSGAGHNVLVRQKAAARFDLIIRGGTLLDGTGAPRYKADVAIAGGSIARVGDLGDARAEREIDARGLFVAPGFINIHSHATPEGLVTAGNMLTQGVTTEIVNADGSGPLDLGAQLTSLTERGLAVNVGANIGFNSVWTEVVGRSDRRPNPAEVERMRGLVAAGLTAGAWGVSGGLDYKPAYYAETEDVVRILDVARWSRTYFANHDRVTPESGFSSLAGMAETIDIGVRTGITPLITHMKVQGHEQGRAGVITEKMRQATDRGVYTAADVYPYLAGQTALVAFTIPGWAQDGGRTAMLERFADPALRARIVKEAEVAMDKRFGGPANVYLPDRRQTLEAVTREMQAPPGEAVVRLLELGNPGIIAYFGIEADLVAILQHPTSSVSCDCGAVVGDAAHPRYFGTFPRVLGRYVREQQALTWEDAVRRMTGLPAATIGMVDRGLLAAGMAADVVVFDPAAVIDRATFEQPTLASEGIRYVVVNGRLALADGAVTAERAGIALRRTPHMPARPMNAAEARRTGLRSRPGPDAAAIEVSQAAGARQAGGTFRLSQASSGVALEITEFGTLQTAPNWASFTGRGRLRPGAAEESVTVILDGDDVVVVSGEFTLTTALRGRR
jgi:N-acyl-D-aspartate/D-glutamate deacylase/CubicO group peptidase (beta-lactamase class C family)